MFCKWCGVKVFDIGSPCPSCGKAQPPLESGTGFWDLCDEKPNAGFFKDSKPLEAVAKDKQFPFSHLLNKKYGNTARTTVLAIILMSLLSVMGVCVLTIQASHNSEALSSLRSELSTFRQTASEVPSELSIRLDGISEEISKLNSQFSEINEKADIPQTHGSSTVTPNSPPEQKPAGDNGETTNDSVPFSESELRQTSNLEMQRFNSADDDTLIYCATGDLLSNESIKLIWQESRDNGVTWKVVAKDVSSIATNKPDSLFRVVCCVKRTEIIDLSHTEELQVSELLGSISKHKISNHDDIVFFSITGAPLESPNAAYFWQIRSSNGNWVDLHNMPVCIVRVADLKRYRLIIFNDVYYYAVYAEDSEPFGGN